MALLGVLAGVHGNSEALGAVLAALGRRHVPRLLCAGDVVGYNADPDECARMLREQHAIAVAGRNDLVAAARLGLQGCPSRLAHALKRTRRSLDAQAKAWLRTLPVQHLVDGSVALVHAGVRETGDPMDSPERIRANAQYLRYDLPGARLCVFGRGPDDERGSTGPQAWAVDGNVVRPLAAAGTLRLQPGVLHFIHPGPVDAQGRRERKLACCAILDTLEWTVEFLELPYDAASTEAKAAVFGYRMNGWTSRLRAVEGGVRGLFQPRRASP